MHVITAIGGKEVFDSRGIPTIEVSVSVGSFVGIASVPSGKSTGIHEAHELRDGVATQYNGLGVQKALALLDTTIAPAIIGKSFSQSELDNFLITLDGTNSKARIGANTILAVSLAFARAQAQLLHLELYEYIGQLAHVNHFVAPQPFFNIINGGKHSQSGLDIQEYLIVPIGPGTMAEKLAIVHRVFESLKNILLNKKYDLVLGDEGGYAPLCQSNEEALDMLVLAIKGAGYSTDTVKIALDCAASSFYKDSKYHCKINGITGAYDVSQMSEWYLSLIQKYPLISIEDPFAEDDWEGFMKLQTRVPYSVCIVGDDLTVTNKKRISIAFEKKAISSVLIKPNQIGTLTETLEAILLTKQYHWKPFISHRSGETMDTFIADLAVGTNSPFIKAGSLTQDERLAKYNRLDQIEKKIYSHTPKTPIIVTIGPASSDMETMHGLFKHNARIARLNFAWNDDVKIPQYIASLREVEKMIGRKIPIIQDLPGIRIQQGTAHTYNSHKEHSFTETDKKYIQFGVIHDLDYVALSFVGSKEDVLLAQRAIQEAQGHQKIIAKIERKIAVENLEEILEVADAVMVARGDLGNEYSIAELPYIQETIIQKANAKGKPVIVATQFLFSMTEHSVPTRAEVSDISNAILEGSDALMLSDETASGKYPIEAVSIMNECIIEAEKHTQRIPLPF